MTGALLQLVARGHIDSRLTGNPQISFFKTVYRRHTNFSIEALEQNFTGTVANIGGTVRADIITNGDLVTEMWLDVKIPSGIVEATATQCLTYTFNTGHALIEEVKLNIGGNTIDKHTGAFMNVHTELTDHTDKEKNILNRNRFFDDNAVTGSAGCNDLQLYIPLKFWFNRHKGLALPLVAIYNEPVSVELKTRHVLGLFNVNHETATLDDLSHDANKKIEVKLYANTIYLDKDERRRFAETQQHEYLIEQVQEQVISFQKRVPFNFNYPVKELIWTIQYTSTRQGITQNGGKETVFDMLNQALTGTETAVTQQNNYFNFVCADHTNTDNVGSSFDRNHAFSRATLKINSKNRFESQKPSYFSYLQRLYAGHRTLGDRSEGNFGIRGNSTDLKQSFDHSNVYVYSFALEPEKHQPSGTCNFSKLESCSLEFTDAITTQSKTITIYAINYNILVINGGYAKLAYN